MKKYFLFLNLLLIGSTIAHSHDEISIENIKSAISDCNYDLVSKLLSDDFSLTKKQHHAILSFAKSIRRTIQNNNVTSFSDTCNALFGILGFAGLAVSAPFANPYINKLANYINSYKPVISNGRHGVQLKNYEKNGWGLLEGGMDLISTNIYDNEKIWFVPTGKIAKFIKSDTGKIVIASPIILLLSRALYKGMTRCSGKKLKKKKIQDLESIVELIESIQPE